MSKVACLPEGQIEGLAKLLGECGSGTDITRVLQHRRLTDNSGESTKWRRLYWVFLDVQRQDMCANRVLDFVQSFLTPARFVGRREVFEQRRSELNTILAFSGLEIGADGKFRQREAARTLDEAERRFQKIRGKFQGRRLHSEVLKYCRTELIKITTFTQYSRRPRDWRSESAIWSASRRMEQPWSTAFSPSSGRCSR